MAHLFRRAQGETEDRPVLRMGFNPDAAPVQFNDTLAGGKADSRAADFRTMESLKRDENLVVMFRIDAYTVILNGENPLVALALRRHMNVWPNVSFAVLDRVTDKVLEEPAHMSMVRHNVWKLRVSHGGVRFADDDLQILQGLAERRFGVYRCRHGFAGLANPRELQKGV